MTQFDGSQLCTKWLGWAYTWVPRQEADPKTKTTHSHLEILGELAKIYAEDSIWLPATLCKVVGMDLYVALTSRTEP
jgi:hypothetical protein